MKQIDLLVVDDSAADRASLRFAFERESGQIKLHFAEGGQRALELLLPTGDAPPQLRPHLCLVDIKMPVVSGFDVLHAVKTNEQTSDLPVIIYSGSDDKADVAAAYRGFANGFIKKPADAHGLNEMARVLGRMCSEIWSFRKDECVGGSFNADIAGDLSYFLLDGPTK